MLKRYVPIRVYAADSLNDNYCIRAHNKHWKFIVYWFFLRDITPKIRMTDIVTKSQVQNDKLYIH